MLQQSAAEVYDNIYGKSLLELSKVCELSVEEQSCTKSDCGLDKSVDEPASSMYQCFNVWTILRSTA